MKTCNAFECLLSKTFLKQKHHNLWLLTASLPNKHNRIEIMHKKLSGHFKIPIRRIKNSNNISSYLVIILSTYLIFKNSKIHEELRI